MTPHARVSATHPRSLRAKVKSSREIKARAEADALALRDEADALERKYAALVKKLPEAEQVLVAGLPTALDEVDALSAQRAEEMKAINVDKEAKVRYDQLVRLEATLAENVAALNRAVSDDQASAEIGLSAVRAPRSRGASRRTARSLTGGSPRPWARCGARAA